MRNTKLIKKKIIIREIVNNISSKELDAISDMVKSENFESILSNPNFLASLAKTSLLINSFLIDLFVYQIKC